MLCGYASNSHDHFAAESIDITMRNVMLITFGAFKDLSKYAV